MAKQHRYTAPEVATRDVGRVKQITLLPNYEGGQVRIVYDLGEEVGGVFTARDFRKANVAYDKLPASLLAVLDDLETKALQYAETKGLLPAGAIEAVPVPEPEPEPEP